jgi:D-glycero-alpha-D-manno-heptose 1-phosphate guanylyltransferase
MYGGLNGVQPMNDSIMPFVAMILVGGLGKRLRSVVSDRPKPMAMIGSVPFLEILIGSLADKGVRRFVLLTGYKGEMIEKYFRDSDRTGLDIQWCREASPLGTGGAVKNAEQYATDPTLLVNGDTFFDADLEALFAFHRSNNPQITLSLKHVNEVSRYGSVITDENRRVIGFREKEPGEKKPGWINAGLSLLSHDMIHNLPADRAFSMEAEFFPVLAKSGLMMGFPQDRPFFDIGTPQSYEDFKVFVMNKGISIP